MAQIIPNGSKRNMVNIIDNSIGRTMCINRGKMVNYNVSWNNKNSGAASFE